MGKKKLSRLFIKIALIINILFVACLLASYLSAWISPNILPMLSVMGYAYPILLAANILFVIFWIILKSIRFLYSMLSILLGMGILFSHYQPFNSYIEEDSDISLVTFNTGHNIDQNIPNRAKLVKRDSDILQNFLDTIKADIICLQEGQLPFKTIFKMTEKRGLKMASRKYKLIENSFGLSLITITKYPIISTAELRHNGSIFALISDIIIKNDTMRIINAHLNSNTLSGKDIRDINDIIHFDSVGSKLVVTASNITKRFDRNAKIRSNQADVIINNIKHCKYKVIVCGDFNDTPATYSYQSISRGLSDAFTKKGRGWGNTFAGKLPSIRIDYVLCDKRLTVEAYKVFENIKISDHHPLRCIISTE